MSLTREERNYLMFDWQFWGRPEQLAPPGQWNTWIVNAGRGFGKTRLGAEWVRNMVCGKTPLSGTGYGHIALVGETAADVRDVMVQGPSGILAVSPPDFRPKYTKSERRLEWPNGAVAITFSGVEPEQLRGPQNSLAWCDEIAKWRYANETWDQLQFGMRVGDRPMVLGTTTPKPIPLMRQLIAQARKEEQELGRELASVVVTSGSTYDNAANLASKFLKQMRDRYEGTRLGRQELRAELLDDVMGALWTRRMFDVRSPQAPLAAVLSSSERPPRMLRVVVAVDPSGTSGEDEEDAGDAVGVVAAGLGIDGKYYVLADDTCNLPPSGWSRVAVNCYRKWGADRIVAERNYGGAMVEYTIRTADRHVAYSNVTATRGKTVRAEPVAALYEQGKVLHIGSFPDLENELCSFTRNGYVGGGSPNRADALVWAITELVGPGGGDEYDPDIYARLGAR